MAKDINIKITDVMLRESLASIIKHPHNKLIAQAIIENLENTEEGFSNLFHAQNGYQKKLTDYNLKIGSLIDITLDKYELSTYNWDKPAMEKAQMILNNSIEAIVIGVNRTRTRFIEVEFMYMDESGKRIRHKDWISDNVINKKTI